MKPFKRVLLDSAIDWSSLFLPVGALVCVLVLGEAGRRVAEALEEGLRFRVEHYAHYLLLKKAAQLDSDSSQPEKRIFRASKNGQVKKAK